MVVEKLYNLIQKEFDIHEINKDMNIQKDFNVDSISLLEFIMDIEEEFDIEIEDEDLESLETVGDLVSYIEKLV